MAYGLFGEWFDFDGDSEELREMHYAKEELKEAAFEALQLSPGSDFGDWQHDLVFNHPTEVVDALGCDPAEAFAALSDLWEDDYCDPATGIERKFSEWAEAFATEEAVRLYLEMSDILRRLRDD